MSVSGIRHLFTCLSVAVALSIAGCWELDLDLCFPASEQPLADATTVSDDDELVGEWTDGDPNRVPVEIEKIAGKPGHYQIRGLVDRASKHTLVCTKLGGRKCASVELDEAAKDGTKIKGHYFIAYEIKHRSELIIYRPQNRVLAAAIKKGDITGKVEFYEKSKDPKSIEISAPTEDLRKYLTANAEQVFPEQGKFPGIRAAREMTICLLISTVCLLLIIIS
jgi:hypothetical protein